MPTTKLTMLAFLAFGGVAFGQLRRYPLASPVAPMGPATEQFEDFPIHIRVLESRWNFDRRLGNYVGWGHADILGPAGLGFDFTYNCDAPFLYNDMKGQFYEANWKKPEQKLDILIQQIGGKHVEKCTLKTTLRPALFSRDSLDWEPPQPTPPPTPTPQK